MALAPIIRRQHGPNMARMLHEPTDLARGDVGDPWRGFGGDG